MFIIFGWLKEEQAVKPLIDTYCYHCSNSSTWHLCKETEWVTFFDIRTIPFITEYFIVCERCNDVFDLDKKTGRKVMSIHKLSSSKSEQLHDKLVKNLEKHQLANKTERQLAYIKAMRARDNDEY